VALLLDDPRIQTFQRAVADFKNGDPYVFVERLEASPAGHDPAGLLAAALDDGRIDRAILYQDQAMGWGTWGALPAGGPPPTFVRPGYALQLTPVDHLAALAFLSWAVRGPKPYATSLTMRTREAADAIVEPLWRALCGAPVPLAGPAGWRFWRVKPDFLGASDQAITDDGCPALFDTEGTNEAWLGMGADRWWLVMISIYPCPYNFDDPDWPGHAA
jgi:hypothetical protein